MPFTCYEWYIGYVCYIYYVCYKWYIGWVCVNSICAIWYVCYKCFYMNTTLTTPLSCHGMFQQLIFILTMICRLWLLWLDWPLTISLWFQFTLFTILPCLVSIYTLLYYLDDASHMITDQCLCLLRGRKIFVGQQEREEGGFRMPRRRALLLVHGHRPAGSLDLSGRGLLWPGGLQGCDGSVHTQTDWLSLTWLLSLTFELIKIRACRCDQLSKVKPDLAGRFVLK